MSDLRNLYYNMPLYARMFDEMGILQHVCSSIQPTYDTIFRKIEQRPEFYDPAIIPEEYLDWLQQFIFGSGSLGGDHWLGVGLNPNWPASYKREAIPRMFHYWKTRGTEIGIREAIDLWLAWPEQVTKLYIAKPFDRTPERVLPNWWDYFTSYGSDLNQTFIEKQRLGSGDYPQEYQPDWIYLYQNPWKWMYDEVWSDHFLASSPAPIIQNTQSELGPRCCWMDFNLNENEWNKIFPNIHELNWEIWDAIARPSVLGWFDYTDISGSLKIPALTIDKDKNFEKETYNITFDIDGFQYFDIYPYSIYSKGWTEYIATQQTEEFQSIPGFRYENLWPAVRKQIGLKVSQQEEIVTGFYSEFGYQSIFYSAVQEEIIEVDIFETNNNFFFYQNYDITTWNFGYWWNCFLAEEWDIKFKVINTVYVGESWPNPSLPVSVITNVSSPIWSDNILAINYYSNYREWVTESIDTIVHPPIFDYFLGFSGEVYSENLYTKQVIDRHNILLVGSTVDPIEHKIQIQAENPGIVGWDWFSLWDKNCFDDFSPINVFNIDYGELASCDFAVYVEIDIPDYKNIYTSNNSLGKPYLPEILETHLVPGYIKFNYNQDIIFYDSRYNNGAVWYYRDFCQEIDITIIQNSVIQQFCNISDRYSIKKIDNYQKTPIEISDNPAEVIYDNIYPLLSAIKDTSRWILMIETLEKLILMKPITAFFVKENGERSQTFSPGSFLYLEFFSYLDMDSQAKSIALWMENNQHIIYDTFTENLNLSSKARIGGKFLIPIQLS